MTRFAHIAKAVGCVCAFVMLIPDYACAYIDPGAGSYFFQFLIAGLVGAGFALRRYWSQIVSYFRRPDAEVDSDR